MKRVCKLRLYAMIILVIIFHLVFAGIYLTKGYEDAVAAKEEYLLHLKHNDDRTDEIVFCELNNILFQYKDFIIKKNFSIGVLYKGKCISGEVYHKHSFGFLYILLIFLLLVNNAIIIYFTSKKNIEKYSELKEQEGKMSEKTLSLLSENIHHELKTPLVVINNKLQDIQEVFELLIGEAKCLRRRKSDRLLLEKAGCLSDDDTIENCTAMKDFELIKTHIDVIYNIMDRMKNFKNMKNDTKNRSLYDVIDVSFKTLKMFSKNEFKYTIDIKLKSFDVAKMKNEDIMTIFINHIKNAIEANATELSAIFVESRKGIIEIQLMDNGSGIPKKAQKSIFEKGTSTKEVSMDGETRGIGLYLSKYTLNNFGGDDFLIESDSRGTSFGLKIPAIRRR